MGHLGDLGDPSGNWAIRRSVGADSCHHTIPYHTIYYHTIPYITIPYYHTYHTVPSHFIQYHTITVSYHTIPSADSCHSQPVVSLTLLSTDLPHSSEMSSHHLSNQKTTVMTKDNDGDKDNDNYFKMTKAPFHLFPWKTVKSLSHHLEKGCLLLAS